jgi:CRP/FNR family cyclic AMP-dependent transcriptional regulator
MIQLTPSTKLLACRAGNRRGEEVNMVEIYNEIASQLLTAMHSSRGVLTLFFTFVGASLLVFASIVRTMVPLRRLTVGSNLMYLAAACTAPNPISLALYFILVPLSLFRLIEIQNLTRKVNAAAAGGDLSGVWLKPYMKSHRLSAGTILFNKGAPAHSLYLLVEGSIELVEIGKKIPQGEVFGEISFFSQEHARTLSARCTTDCIVLSIVETTFKQLYFQNPAFAFQVVNLITSRLSADIRRLEARVAERETSTAS